MTAITMTDDGGYMKKKILTEAKKKRYVKTGYNKCPYCGSHDIEGSSVEIDGKSALQKIFCLSCERSWRDVYLLAEIEEE